MTIQHKSNQFSRERDCYDVVTIGAGPAGAIASYLLARDGYRVLLIERATFPRHKVCGCCLHRDAVHVIEACCLAKVLADAVPLQRLDLRAFGRHAKWALQHGVALSRATLDERLVDAVIRKGVIFRDDTTASFHDECDEFTAIQLSRGKSNEVVHARAVIAADGLAGSFTRKLPGVRSITKQNSWIGAGCIGAADSSLPIGTVRMMVCRGGYLGAVRLPDGSVDYAAAVDPQWVRTQRGLASAIREIVTQCDSNMPRDMDSLKWFGTPPLTQRHTAPATRRIFLIGDAAGYVEPFTGEGIAWALLAGRDVAETVRAGLISDSRNLAQTWHQKQLQLLKSRKRRCGFVAAGLRSPLVCRTALGAAAVFPALGQRCLNAFYKPIKA